VPFGLAPGGVYRAIPVTRDAGGLFSLGLGPTNPPTMIVAAEPSAIRWGRFLTSLVLLMPAFSLRRPPPPLVGTASSDGQRSPTTPRHPKVARRSQPRL
jgi:hypothetical protein